MHKLAIAFTLFLAEPAFAELVTVTSSSPIAAQLATLDAGTFSISQDAITPYSNLLNFLDQRCVESKRISRRSE